MILIKTLGREYYRQNVAFYLLLLFIGFGLMEIKQHIELTLVILPNTKFLYFLALLWLLHVLKTLQFVYFSLKLKEYQFLQSFVLQDKFSIWTGLLIFQLILNLPFLLYSFFMVVIGIKAAFWVGVLHLFLINILLLLIPLLLTKKNLTVFNSEKEISIPLFLPKFSKQPFTYYLQYLIRKKLLLFVSSKVFSVFLIMGAAKLYFTDEYDFRLLNLSLFFAGITQITLCVAFISFFRSKLIFERNFPLQSHTLSLRYFLISLTLVFPEILILVAHWHPILGSLHIFSGSLYLILLTLLLLIFPFSGFLDKKEHYNKLFFIAVIHFLLIMFKLPLIYFSALFLMFSIWIILKRYYIYEFTVNQTK